MQNILSDNCYDSDEYIEMITGRLPAYKPSLEDLEAMQLEYWNYPMTEIDHIIENDLKVVLVRFPKLYGGFEYRWCEVGGLKIKFYYRIHFIAKNNGCESRNI